MLIACPWGWAAGPDGEPAARRGTGGEFPAVQRGALAHTDQPETARRRRRISVRAAVVDDLHFDLVGPVAQVHVGARRPRVLERVRQRFLHDAIRRDVDRGRQRALLALDADLDGKLGVAHARRQARKLGQAGLLGQLVAIAGLAQEPEQAVQLRTACRLEVSIAVRAFLALPRSRSITTRAAPAWTPIMLT